MRLIAVFLLGIFALQTLVLAAPKDIKYPSKKLAPTIFSHAKHLKHKGTTCKTCHPKIFPKKKALANKITMKAINKGKFCAVCHKAKGKQVKGKAFVIKKNCAKCHVKPAKKKAAKKAAKKSAKKKSGK